MPKLKHLLWLALLSLSVFTLVNAQEVTDTPNSEVPTLLATEMFPEIITETSTLTTTLTATWTATPAETAISASLTPTFTETPFPIASPTEALNAVVFPETTEIVVEPDTSSGEAPEMLLLEDCSSTATPTPTPSGGSQYVQVNFACTQPAWAPTHGTNNNTWLSGIGFRASATSGVTFTGYVSARLRFRVDLGAQAANWAIQKVEATGSTSQCPTYAADRNWCAGMMALQASGWPQDMGLPYGDIQFGHNNSGEFGNFTWRIDDEYPTTGDAVYGARWLYFWRDITCYDGSTSGTCTAETIISSVQIWYTFLPPTPTPTESCPPSGFAIQNGENVLDDPTSTPGGVCIAPTETSTPTATNTFTPTFTPTVTPSPTFTQEPFEVWHVSCRYPLPAKARNFPTFDGQEMRTYPQGTILYVFESRMDDDGVAWKRVSGYEAYNSRDTFWIRLTDPSGIPLLEPNTPTACNPFTPVPDLAITPLPTATRTFPLASPGCAAGNDCPLTTGTPSDVDVVAFVLACEGGNDQLPFTRNDALNIAYTIRNRMTSGVFRGTAVEVIQESGQWQCYSEGARPGNDLASLDDIDLVIRDYAIKLVNGEPLPTAPDMGIRWYGLYTFGLYSEEENRDNYTTLEIVDLLSNDDGDGYCSLSETILTGIFVALNEFGTRFNATAFFSANPHCQL